MFLWGAYPQGTTLEVKGKNCAFAGPCTGIYGVQIFDTFVGIIRGGPTTLEKEKNDDDDFDYFGFEEWLILLQTLQPSAEDNDKTRADFRNNLSPMESYKNA